MAIQRTPLRIAFARPWPGTIRGRILALCALILSAKGFGYATNPTAQSEGSMRFLALFAPPVVWSVLIVATCAFAWFCSYCHHGRDRWGYDALTAMSGGLAASFALTVVRSGDSVAVQGALAWLAIAVLLVSLRRLRDVRDEIGRSL